MVQAEGGPFGPALTGPVARGSDEGVRPYTSRVGSDAGDARVQGWVIIFYVCEIGLRIVSAAEAAEGAGRGGGDAGGGGVDGDDWDCHRDWGQDQP